MSEHDDYLRSVNWTTGMLLTPQHFLRQDHFIEEQLAWLVRYCLPGSGLVGGGVRLEPGEQGLGKFDPKVELQNGPEGLSVAVLRARGLTPSGEVIEIDESRVVRATFSRADLAGIADVLVHVVRTGAKEPDPDSIGVDAANPNQAALSRDKLEVRLGIAADVAPHALIVAKLRRASESLGFELDGQYVPPCVTLLAHSSLLTTATRLQDEIRLLVGEFQLVHEKSGVYAERVSARGIDVRGDLEVRAFVERAVLSLEAAAFETSDLTIPPQRFLQQIERTGRLVALALHLSSSTRQFFKDLSAVDASYTELLETERGSLAMQREIDRRLDLRPLLVRATEALQRLRQLVEALAGKYVDYRINRSVESIKFMLDRDGEHFYEAVSSPSHPQREGDMLTFVFSQLELAGRHEYRVVLTGDPRSSYQWEVGKELTVTLRINASGGPRPPLTRMAMCDVEGQRNFAVNFDTPTDVTSIAGLTVTVQPGTSIRGAILFRRRLGFASGPSGGMPPMPPSPATPPPGDPSKPRIVFRGTGKPK